MARTDIRPAALLTHWVGMGEASVDGADRVLFEHYPYFNRSGQAQEQTMLLASTN